MKIMKKSYITSQPAIVSNCTYFIVRVIIFLAPFDISNHEILRALNSRISVKSDWGKCRASFITSDYCIKIEFKGSCTDQYGGNDSEILAWKNCIDGSGFEYLFAKATEFSYNGCCCEIMPRIKGVGTGGYDVYYYLNEEEREFVYSYFEDMHLYNYGFKNRRPVIIDYACQC